MTGEGAVVESGGMKGEKTGAGTGAGDDGDGTGTIGVGDGGAMGEDANVGVNIGGDERGAKR
jgi:hypothetical protein